MIRVDDRERRSGICEALSRMSVEYVVERLERADYVVRDNVYIERKTTADFLDCLSTRRLFEQAARLCAGRRCCVLIIEGARLPGRPSVRGALYSLAVKRRLPVLRSSDTYGTAWCRARMAAQAVLPLLAYVPSARVHHPSLPAEQRMVWHAAGMGLKLSGKRLAHFRGVRNILPATSEAYETVEG